MPELNFQSISSMIANTKGYLSFNQRKDTIEVQGKNFLSRLVTWIRYQRNEAAHQAAMQARDKIVTALTQNNDYSDFFRAKIAEKFPAAFQVDKKPLSARKVKQFITTVTKEAESQRAQEARIAEAKRATTARVEWFVGRGGTDASRDWLPNHSNQMLIEKTRDMPAIKAQDVDTHNLAEEVFQTTMANKESVEAASTAMEMEPVVLQALNGVLDKRVAEAVKQHRLNLNQTLDSAGLDPKHQKFLKSFIDINSNNLTQASLIADVNRTTVEQIEEEFQGLFKEALQVNEFKEILQGTEAVKKDLCQTLNREVESMAKVVTVDTMRERAAQLLKQFIASKNAALALAPARMASVDSLVKRLVLQNPFIGERQAKIIQAEVDGAFQESYQQHQADYKQSKITEKNFVSKLRQLHYGDVLFPLLKKAVEPTDDNLSMFDNPTWTTGVKEQVQQYVKQVTGEGQIQQDSYQVTSEDQTQQDFKRVGSPKDQAQQDTERMADIEEQTKQHVKWAAQFIEGEGSSYGESLQELQKLKGQLPEFVYQKVLEGVEAGAKIGPGQSSEFYATANAQYIQYLTENNRETLYRLFSSPEVLDRRLGSVNEDVAHKKQFESFTLRDLLQTLPTVQNEKKNVATHEKIGQIIPYEKMEDLLDRVQNRLELVRSHIMTQTQADAMFQREIVNFLREQNIDFASQVMRPEDEEVLVRQETPL